jgi:5-methylthioadenosine/S-adenosylhomocysteine deaminase
MSILIKSATLLSGKKADVLIEGNLISKIAPEIKASADEKIDAKGKLLLPGLVNTHTHAGMALFRGIGPDAELADWLAAVRKLEANVTAQQVGAGSRLACLEMIKSGTTCFSDMYFHMDAVAEAVEKSGMRATLGYSTVDMEDERKRKGELAECERFIREWNGKAGGRIACSVPPHSIYLCSKELLEKSRELSDKYGVILHMHLSETRKEVFDCLSKNKLRPAYYLDSIGFLSDKTVAAHCVWMTKEEVRLLASRGVSSSLCPVSNMKLAGGGVAPYPEMLSLGMNVSLGTDGSASNDSLSMLETMKFLALLVKNSRWDAAAATAQQMVHAATKGGAKALHIDAGEIKEGKLADIILLDLHAPNMAPLHSAQANLVYSAHAGNVTDSIINGKIVMHESKVLTLDEEKVVEEIQDEAERLRG